MIRVHILACGSTTVDEALPFAERSRNPLAFTGIGRGKKHKIQVPVRAYLIEHPRGLVLVDTGWDDVIRRDARRYEGFMNYFASPGFLPAGEGIIDQLSQLGYSVKDLDCCILTHMDIDHAGGLQEVRGVKHIMCSQAEWAAAQKPNPRYHKPLWDGVNIETFPNRSYDVFQDGTVTAFPMHGHSAGMTALRVGTEEHYVIIAGDAGYGRASWERLSLPGVEWNRKETLKSLKKLQAMAEDKRCEAVLMTHDPEESKQVYEL